MLEFTRFRVSSAHRSGEMAASVRHRSLSMARLHSLRSALPLLTRSFASDALVELKPGEIGMVAGIPQEHLRRRVLIYSPARTATQQGSGKVGRWKINFHSTQKWENPLMGWTSTGDPYANVGDAALSFDSEEAAKAFAEKHGWDYVSFVSTLVNNTKLKKKKMMNLQADSENDERQIREFPKRKKELPETLCSLVKKRHTPILKVKAYADNFKWKGPPKSEEN